MTLKATLEQINNNETAVMDEDSAGKHAWKTIQQWMKELRPFLDAIRDSNIGTLKLWMHQHMQGLLHADLRMLEGDSRWSELNGSRKEESLSYSIVEAVEDRLYIGQSNEGWSWEDGRSILTINIFNNFENVRGEKRQIFVLCSNDWSSKSLI